MAVLTVTHLSSGDGNQDSGPSTKIVEIYEVVTDDKNDNSTVVRAATGIPSVGNKHVDDTSLIAENVSSRRNKKYPLVHTVTVDYGSRSGTLPENEDPETGEVIENPLNRPAIVRGNSTRTTKSAPKAYFLESTGPDVWSALRPIQTSARELVPIEQETTDKQIVVVNNESHSNTESVLTLQDTWVNTINTTAWLGNAVGTVRVSDIAYDFQRENNIPFVQMTYTLDIRKDTWYDIIKDQGFYWLEWDGTENTMTQRKIIDKDTSKWTIKPIPLDLLGQVLDLTGTTNDADPTDLFKFRTWRTYEFAEFNIVAGVGGLPFMRDVK